MGDNLRLDHIVILVNDLAAAIGEYTALGFTVVPGGAHDGSPTHNALIALADGSYLELIARRPGTEGTPGGLAARLLRTEPDEALADFALLADDLPATVQAARAGGLALGDPLAMGRTRPDGQQIAWELSFPPTLDLPFLIADTTPRAWRVPGGAATEHANGVTGVAQLIVAVQDLDASIDRYRALLDTEPQPWPEFDQPPIHHTNIILPHSHPHYAEIRALMQQLHTQLPESERAALLDRIRAKMEAGRAAGFPWGGEVREEWSQGQPAERGVDFVLGTTTISLAMALIDIPWPHSRLAKHGEGLDRLALRAPRQTHSRELGRGSGYPMNIIISEEPITDH